MNATSEVLWKPRKFSFSGQLHTTFVMQNREVVKVLIMPPISQDMAMGAGIIALCLMLLFRERWFLEQTRKGRSLVEWFGAGWALWVLRAILLVGATFGGLLANGTIRPIQW